MAEINHHESHNDDEITLKELILKIKEFYQEAMKHWFLILVSGTIIGLFMGYKAYKSKLEYNAQLTFMVNDDEGGGMMGSLGGLLGTFGLGGGGGGSYNLDKILELSKTRKIGEKVLFNKVNIDGNNDYLANHIINYKDTIGEWGAKPFYNFWSPESKVKNFRFKADSIPAFSKIENSVLKSVHGIVVGGEKTPGILSSSYAEETGILRIKVNSGNEEISYHLCKLYYNELSKYYIDKTIEKQKFTFEIINAKNDSVQLALKNAQYALANFKDTNQNLFTKKDNLSEIRLAQEVQKLGIMYGETAKNLEIADFSLKNKTPFMQEIDAPLLPLKGTKSSTFRSLIMGGFLGAFLCIGFVFMRKIYRDTMD